MRQSSLNNLGVGLSREIPSGYDDIKAVADNIDAVTLLGTQESLDLITEISGLDLVSIINSADSIDNLTVTVVETLEPGESASAELVDNVLELRVPKGATGSPGTNGLTPVVTIEYVKPNLVSTITYVEGTSVPGQEW